MLSFAPRPTLPQILLVTLLIIDITPRDLTSLARSGVLLLNTLLTVRKQAPLSHAKRGWETFTAEVIRTLATRKSQDMEVGGKGVVIFAWGLPAQKLCDEIGIDEVCRQLSRRK